MALRRISKELREMRANPENDLYQACPVSEEDLYKWKAIITGPKGTPFEGGIFPLAVHFPSNYPFKPPKVRYLVQIYHPWVNSNGSVCLDWLDPGRWSPVVTLAKILLSLRECLITFYPEEPMVPEIARIYRVDRALFNRTAREWTRKYASPESEICIAWN